MFSLGTWCSQSGTPNPWQDRNRECEASPLTSWNLNAVERQEEKPSVLLPSSAGKAVKQYVKMPTIITKTLTTWCISVIFNSPDCGLHSPIYSSVRHYTSYVLLLIHFLEFSTFSFPTIPTTAQQYALICPPSTSFSFPVLLLMVHKTSVLSPCQLFPRLDHLDIKNWSLCCITSSIFLINNASAGI